LREILRHNCVDQLSELKQLEEMIGKAEILPELQPFHDWVELDCAELRQKAEQNLADLNSGEDSILPDILSETQNLWLALRIFNSRFVSHLLRACPTDRLCLRLVRWLHSSHPETRFIPVCLNDGGFATLPSTFFPVVYFIPPSAQLRLLYLPLLFHEYGHVLYICHKPEMDALVKDLQNRIRELLEPRSQRDDLKARSDEANIRLIVEAWYEWAQELFCDAVGFAIGGPAFARAFSMFLRMSGREALRLSFEELKQCEHPVTWLRIRLIADRARKSGYPELAAELEESWQKIAVMMSVEEDYQGFFEERYLHEVQRTIEDMLIEADPVACKQADIQVDVLDDDGQVLRADFTPVQLLNQAWRRFLNDHESYADWERAAIEKLFDAHEFNGQLQPLQVGTLRH